MWTFTTNWVTTSTHKKCSQKILQLREKLFYEWGMRQEVTFCFSKRPSAKKKNPPISSRRMRTILTVSISRFSNSQHWSIWTEQFYFFQPCFKTFDFIRFHASLELTRLLWALVKFLFDFTQNLSGKTGRTWINTYKFSKKSFSEWLSCR